MAKITNLNRMTPLEANGQELVPVVKNGTTRAAAIGDIVAPAAKPFVDAAAGQATRAELAAASAAIGALLFDTVEAGLLAMAEGSDFRVRGTGDTYAEDYRNVGGVATKLPGELPSKAYMDGIAPAVNSKVMVLAKASGVDTSNISLDSGAAIRAALTEAMLAGKTVDLGVDTFRIGSQWSGNFPATQTVKIRGDGGRFQNISAGNKGFMAVRAPILIDGVDFENFAAVLTADTNGIDISDHDIVLRNINHLNAGQGIILNTLESFRIRDLIMENITIIGVLNPNGTGKGQGIRYQANGFRRAYLRNIFVQNTSYQGVRVGGYPHDLVLNKHIHMETIHVDTCVGTTQCNGIQAFGSDVYLDDLYVRRVDCVDGGSSNVEPVYTVGDRVSIGNVTVEDAGNAQGAIAIKSSKTRQHAPLTVRTRLHPRMNAGIRIDGSDADLTKGITFHWIWEPLSPTMPDGAGTDAYAVDYLRLDTALSDTVEHYFVPHAVNTTSAPTLKVGGFPAKPMVQSTGGVIYPGQLRPDVVYKAVYSPTADRFNVRAAIWTALVPIVDGANNNITLPDALVDGKTYWAIPMRSMGAGATMTVGGQTLPIMVRGANGLTPHTSGGPVSNGFIKGFWYSAADQAMIVIAPSGTPYEGTGRFVPELRGQGDAFTFTHPYAADFADALFVMPTRDNTGPATLNGDPLLTSTGSALTAGYIRAHFLYQLIRDPAANTWRATRVGGNHNAIDTASGAGGRQIIKDVTFINAQYGNGIASYSDGFAEVSSIKMLGQSRLGRVVSFSTTSDAPVQARAYVSDFKISHFGMDVPSTSLIGISQRFSILEVENIPPPVIRGAVTQTSAVVAGVTTPGAIALLRMRGVRRGASGYAPVTQAQGFAVIDSDHVTETVNVDPPSVGAGGYYEFPASYTHVGAEPGDAVTITHEQNATRLQFGGYCTARDTVKAFVRDPNPAGAAVDLATGRLFITSRRLRA